MINKSELTNTQISAELADLRTAFDKIQVVLKNNLPRTYKGTLQNLTLMYTYMLSKGGTHSRSHLMSKLNLSCIQYEHCSKLLAKYGFIKNANKYGAKRYNRWVASYRQDLEGMDYAWAWAVGISSEAWITYERISISLNRPSTTVYNALVDMNEDELNYHLNRVSREEIFARHDLLHKITTRNRLMNVAIGLAYRKLQHKRDIKNVNINYEDPWCVKVFNRVKEVINNAYITESFTIKDYVKILRESFNTQINPLYERLWKFEEARI